MSNPCTISIPCENVAQLCAIVSGLVREGLVVTVEQIGGDWKIRITGY